MDELFENILPTKRQKLLQRLEATSVNYQKKSVILMREASIGIVNSGLVQIIKYDSEGNVYQVEEFSENDIFVVTDIVVKSEDYEVFAKEESEVTLIDFSAVTKGFSENSTSFNQLLRNMVKIMTNNISKKNERIEILVNKTIRNKLLSYFKIMYKKTNSRIIYLPSTFTDLAEYLAVDRSAMNRELKNLKDEGFIEINNKRIKLLYFV